MNPHHLISIAGLSAGQFGHLLDSAQALRPDALSGSRHRTALAGKTVCTLFFEPSTRTRSSFQLAAARLGADVLSFDAGSSSAKKGETAVDTLRNLEAMGVDCFVVRTGVDGELQTLIDALDQDDLSGSQRAVHSLQGVLVNFGAQRAISQAERLSASLHEPAQATQWRGQAAELGAALEEVYAALQALIAAGPEAMAV